MGDMGRDRSSIVDRCVDAGVERFGVVKGARMGGRVALFVGQWCRYLEEHNGEEPTMIEFTAPVMTRESVSRPYWSVPMGWFQEGPWSFSRAFIRLPS